MNSVLLAGEDLLNETQMIRDCVAALGSACESILNDVTIARTIVREGGDTSDSMLLMQYLNEQTEAIKQQVKLIKRRLPQDIHVIKCGISPLKLEAMPASIESDNTAEHTIEHSKFWELLTQACERVYEQDDRGPSQNFKGMLAQANSDLQQMAQYLLDKEYEIMSLANQKQEKPISPIISRAQLIKKQLEQKNVLAATLENREADIKQLKLAAKLKQNELSEMQIRKDLAEKKLSVLQSEYEHTVEKWKRQYEEAHAQLEQLQKKEKEYEVTLDHLQSDIEALESEKSTLREKLKTTGGGPKRFADSSLTTTSSSGAAFAHHGVTGSTPIIAEELQLLKTVLHNERNTRLRMQAQQIREKLKKFEPIHVPQPKDKRITELEGELTRMKHAWALSLLQAGPKPDTTGIESIVAMQRRHQQLPAKAEISTRANHLAAEILAEYLQRNPHRAANCEFAAFPTVEVKRVLKI
ncbi:unnamed protein product [Ceratitis capitata]|uniref:(Mediterranean fruit fly) hypothetical protein n=1 Tax=Ceratitis capitata TaxID=7213 RepID=A0A811V5G9_CERCA|nr:unnamed protein product [Ceratitis capitata]